MAEVTIVMVKNQECQTGAEDPFHTEHSTLYLSFSITPPDA